MQETNFRPGVRFSPVSEKKRELSSLEPSFYHIREKISRRLHKASLPRGELHKHEKTGKLSTLPNAGVGFDSCDTWVVLPMVSVLFHK